MNYGYTPDTQGFNPSRMAALALHLNRLLKRLKLDEPYIELNGLYPGVRIRKITNLSEKQHRKLVEAADKIYEQVMLT